jgi:hypothetical protein
MLIRSESYIHMRDEWAKVDKQIYIVYRTKLILICFHYSFKFASNIIYFNCLYYLQVMRQRLVRCRLLDDG